MRATNRSEPIDKRWQSGALKNSTHYARLARKQKKLLAGLIDLAMTDPV